MRFSSCYTMRRASTTATFGGLFLLRVWSPGFTSDCQLTITLIVCLRRIFSFELFDKIAYLSVKELRERS